MSSQVSRLIGDAQALLEEEAFAIYQGDFEYLQEVGEKKGDILDKLVDLLSDEALCSKPPEVEELIQKQHENYAALELKKKEMSHEHKDREATLKKQLRVCKSYAEV